MNNIFRKFLKDRSGQFAVWIGIAALPIMMVTSYGLDYASAERGQLDVKSALDSAVLAAATDNSLSISEKETRAVDHFHKNYAGDIKFALAPAASSGRVEMSAKGLAPVSLAEMAGIKGIEIYENSAAVMTSDTVICALALAPNRSYAIDFYGANSFLAPTCAVHANSTSPEAIVAKGKNPPVAQNFCAGGGAWGTFVPAAKGNCEPIADPYQYHKAPAPGPCINTGPISDILSLSGKNLQNVTGSNILLPPGTYCGGLTVDGTNVTFLPGNHIMLDGPLIFSSGAQAVGDRITFVLNGLDSVLTVQKGAKVDIVAPSSGPLAGLAIFQDVQAQLGKAGSLPNGVNTFASDGHLNVTGTVYFPPQSVDIYSTATFGSHAPATSFIAYSLAFGGTSTTKVAVDHQSAGLPPIMPRSEDGARLVE